MIPRFLFIVCILAVSSCKKNEKTVENNIIITGSVIDQVTREPVDGATVFLAGLPFCEQDYRFSLENFDQPIKSGSDGRYKFKFFKTTYEDFFLNFPGCKMTYALKDGYSGSSQPNIHAEGGEVDENIELYHFAELNLHVKNDTTNNIDSVELWLDSYMSAIKYPQYRKICIGNNFDTVFVFNQLWGNEKYFLNVVNLGALPYRLYQTFFSYDLTLVPDKINTFSISF